jgi:hypothetical protein
MTMVDGGKKWLSTSHFSFTRSYKHLKRLHRFQNADYPDIWIDPNESPIVVTINAGEIVKSSAFAAGVTLRFPRITRLRDAYDKDVTEIESDLSLWNKFEDVTEKRGTGLGTISSAVGSPAKTPNTAPCRFLTEKQYGIEKKKKKPRATGIPSAVPVPNVKRIKSKVLAGREFTVLDGKYSLGDNNIDADEAKAEGWYAEARLVTSSACVKYFIQEHSGVVHVNPDVNKDIIVLGGIEDDARVFSFLRAIELAPSRRDHWLSSKSKDAGSNAGKYDRLSEHPGVVRWTFVYSMVRHLLSSGTEALHPTGLDYLARPRGIGYSSQAPELDLCREDLSSTVALRRALEIVGSAEEANHESSEGSWRSKAVTHLDPDKRWIMSGRHQNLWPFKEGRGIEQVVVIYPDIFLDVDTEGIPREISSRDDLAKEETRSEAEIDPILSALPLAFIMGAQVTSTLDATVTHVLCNLLGDQSCIEGLAGLEAINFANAKAGERLVRLLRTRRQPSDQITIVSPDWLRKRKWGQIDFSVSTTIN